LKNLNGQRGELHFMTVVLTGYWQFILKIPSKLQPT